LIPNPLKVSVMTLSRRKLFTAASAAVCCGSRFSVLTAADPPKRTGNPLLKLSLAGYSFNRMFAKRGTPEEIAKAEMNIEKFIEFCAAQGLGAAELTGYYFPKVITPEYLLSIRAMTHRLGISISGTAIGNDFCLVEGEARQKQLAECREWIDYASMMGAPAIRIFAGKVPSGDSEDAAIERCAAGVNESLKYAATKGVFLALENHGGITATPEQMMKIIDKIDTSPWFGVNFDSGNFQTDDPYRDLAKIAPYAVNAQIKASISINGKKQPADYVKIIEILKNAGYRGFVALEYEEAESPFEAIPKILETLRPLCS
jgi:sugar phosphate isomerase/epimerase